MNIVDGAGKPIDELRFSHDRVGDILAVQEDGLHDASFKYDPWYRVTQARLGDETLDYAFDNLDRVVSTKSSLTGSKANLSELSYSDTAQQQLQRAGALTYAYDAAGGLTERGDLQIERDFQERPVRFEKSGKVQTHLWGVGATRVAQLGPDGLVLYGFDNFEVRDGVSLQYVRLGQQRLARRQSTDLMVELYGDDDGDGALTAADAYSHALAGQGDDADVVSTQRMLGAVAARMLADSSDEMAFLHSNHLGSLIAATDEGGEVRGRRAYYPSGMIRHQEGFVDAAYGFSTQEYNPFTGLIEFQFRDLDPLTSRWTSFDPSFEKVSASSMDKLGEATTGYAYVANNFASSVDPTGLFRRRNRHQGRRGPRFRFKNPFKRFGRRRGNNRDAASNAAKSSEPKVETVQEKKERLSRMGDKLLVLHRESRENRETREFVQEEYDRIVDGTAVTDAKSSKPVRHDDKGLRGNTTFDAFDVMLNLGMARAMSDRLKQLDAHYERTEKKLDALYEAYGKLHQEVRQRR